MDSHPLLFLVPADKRGPDPPQPVCLHPPTLCLHTLPQAGQSEEALFHQCGSAPGRSGFLLDASQRESQKASWGTLSDFCHITAVSQDMRIFRIPPFYCPHTVHIGLFYHPHIVPTGLFYCPHSVSMGLFYCSHAVPTGLCYHLHTVLTGLFYYPRAAPTGRFTTYILEPQAHFITGMFYC